LPPMLDARPSFQTTARNSIRDRGCPHTQSGRSSPDHRPAEPSHEFPHRDSSSTREALAAADAAAVASGTVTLEAALLGIPLVIVYKESFLNWHLLGQSNQRRSLRISESDRRSPRGHLS
jgi:hypothetical protein